ncbi:hypothetical protein SU69_06005 [Thermosipho melanesiensis]|uniref:Histone deacetylase superfamily n=2 Tax=Thermosipho melanesiensis TaxID=46541 RepID=A6LM84_THEM4|nr:histone deacetylase family protein [Thermosipho melanesiensis]ABR31035.1 histone deacetylase superfamily [Thermosipho melanesiensis BI429]APT74129.1 histone deacetylase [Thermosipho melanesiensis]OOC36077.1 hypothetical protein SU68_06075 [Thermosipho melanesiensis]OOC36894.1 hypothetical protein SU69_06005 [Thermosipho melanesiensis]OOC37645.1 hypothetical protein SU70_06015 [Thermosipho melanesiensis]
MKVVLQLNDFYIPTLEIDNGKIVKNPEIPSRLESIKNFVSKTFETIPAKEYPINYIHNIHPKWYVEHVKKISSSTNNEYLPEVFLKDRILDSGTPVTPVTYKAALNAYYASITGANLDEKYVYILTRPPGHHASKDFAGGYCFFNNAAIIAKYLQSIYQKRICILDIDFHHGNGTQEIFYYDPNIVYISIHGTPEKFFPWISGFREETGSGDGKGTNFNFPLDGGTNWREYKVVFEMALEIIEKVSPYKLIVSLGFDTHINDPMGHFNLQDEDYKHIGVMLKKLDIPIIFVQEGGYNKESNKEAAKNLFFTFGKE